MPLVDAQNFDLFLFSRNDFNIYFVSIKFDNLAESEEQDADSNDGEFVEYSDLQISNPLGLLTREYKHPLSMYEEAQQNIYARFDLLHLRFFRLCITTAFKLCCNSKL